MIGSLRGTLLERSPDGEVLVEVSGVGYRVSVTPRTLGLVGDPGGEVFLYVHDHVREDAHTLYGFLARDERSCFEALLGAHGVGPALALAIMAVHAPLDLRRAVAADDADALCLVPGVGKKTAARLLIELKSRLEVPDLDLTALQGSAGGHASPSVVGRRPRRAHRPRLRPRRGARRDARPRTRRRLGCVAARSAAAPRVGAQPCVRSCSSLRQIRRSSRSKSACDLVRSTSSSARAS